MPALLDSQVLSIIEHNLTKQKICHQSLAESLRLSSNDKQTLEGEAWLLIIMGEILTH